MVIVIQRLSCQSVHANTILNKYTAFGYRHYAVQAVSYKKLPGGTHPDTIKSVSYGKPASKPHRTVAVNPPTTTLPPPLTVPERRPDQSTPGYLFSIGKSYLSFYKTALKAIWGNHKQSQVLVSRIPRTSSDGKHLTFALAAKSGLLTRSEFQLILRSRSDVKKLPLVGLLLAICGEFTPLLVIFVAGMIPRAAWIPKQVQRSRSKIEERRKKSFRRDTVMTENSLKSLARHQGLDGLSAAQILHISRTLGLHSTFWETFWDSPPQWLTRRRVLRAIDYLDADDQALHRDGGVRELSDDEVKMAAEERGIDVLKDKIETIRGYLDSYMKWRIQKKVNLPVMTLVRPNQYDQIGVI